MTIIKAFFGTWKTAGNLSDSRIPGITTSARIAIGEYESCSSVFEKYFGSYFKSCSSHVAIEGYFSKTISHPNLLMQVICSFGESLLHFEDLQLNGDILKPLKVYNPNLGEGWDLSPLTTADIKMRIDSKNNDVMYISIKGIGVDLEERFYRVLDK